MDDLKIAMTFCLALQVETFALFLFFLAVAGDWNHSLLAVSLLAGGVNVGIRARERVGRGMRMRRTTRRGL